MPIDRDGDGPPLRKDEAKADDPTALRATPFTDDVFDDAYYSRRGAKPSGSPFGLILGVIVGAAIAGGGAWYVMTQQNGAGEGPGGVQIVRADPTPYKIKPEEPGGMQVENQDKTVYDRVAKTDAPTRVENLLPAPEQPKTPPKVEPKPAPTPAPTPAKSEPPKVEAPTPVAAVPTPAAVPQATAPAAKPDDLEAIMADMKKKSEAQEAAAAQASVVAPVATPPPPAAPIAPAPEQVAAVPATVPGGILVQLAASRSEEAALAEWKRVKTKHEALLGALSPTVVRADLGERGVFFRLRAGPVADKAAADALCASLTAQGDACLVVKP
ncbi:MAG: SPOR domain-containing protein [Rhodospirillaceae bacterium]|nr:SPOR domain-containing protein [Rhodospirillaceae bacterium]